MENKNITVNISNLSKRYQKADKLAIEDINIKCYEGDVIGLLGRNGAGKSTTIKCLTGFLPFETGEIIVNQNDIVKEPIEAKKSFGYVPDDRSVFDKMTGMEYLEFMSNIYKVPKQIALERIDSLQEKLQLGDAIYNIISSYSYGMKKKISIMGSLVHDPKVWILDEPFTGLDPQTTLSLRNYIQYHCTFGNTVIFSSHNIDAVEKICNRVYIINNGKILDEVELSGFREKYNMSLEEYFIKKCSESE